MNSESTTQFIKFESFTLPRVFNPAIDATVRVEFLLYDSTIRTISDCPKIYINCDNEQYAEDAVTDAELVLEQCGGSVTHIWDTANVTIVSGKIDSIWFEVPLSELAILNIFHLLINGILISRGRIYYNV